MNEINDGGINQQLVRRFNIVDTAAPAGSLAPEVFPVVLVTPPSLEDEFLRGVYLCAASGYQAATAAQYTHFRLLNVGLGSRNIIIVEDFDFYCTSNGADVVAGVTTGGATYGTIHPSGNRDTRLVPASTTRQTHGVFSSECNISPPLAALTQKRLSWWTSLTATPSINRRADVVLVPGMSFDIACAAPVNVGMTVSIRWRERRAQPSELG